MWHRLRLTWSQRPSVETSAMPMAAKSKAERKRSLSLAFSRASVAVACGAGFSLKKSGRAMVATRHASAPTAIETFAPTKWTPTAAKSAEAKAAELPTNCQKKVRAPSRQGDWLMRYEMPSVVIPALLQESEKTATPAASSAAGESGLAGMSVMTPDESLSAQTTTKVAVAPSAARKAVASAGFLSASAAQAATSAARSTATSPSKRSIARKTKAEAEGKCQP